MRNGIRILIIMVMLISLTACSGIQRAISENGSFVSVAQLTEREKMFFSLGNNVSFSFDFSVSEKYKWAEIWIDRYEFGKKVSSSGQMLTDVSANKKGMILAALREAEKMKHDWTIAINAGGSTSTGSFIQEYKDAENSLFAKTWQAGNARYTIEGGKVITLANVCYKEQTDSTAIRALTEEFYRNPDENIKEILDYNLVYLLRVKFYESDPNK